MPKYIVAVRKDPNDAVVAVKLLGGEIETKTQVIKRLGPGCVYRTRTAAGPGPDVHVVHGRYLRTDGNEILEDNLDELPEF